MSEELSAVPNATSLPAAPSDDYDAICEALMQTARGRWFLQEYARRNRTADTEVLLAAIQRIEDAVCTDRTPPQAPRGFRLDLLEMAKAISRTRAEVADIAPPAASPLPAAGVAATQSRDVFAAAERIRDVTWEMRGHGFDPSTCDQLEELASSILSARALRDPADHRVSKLSEVLGYLEQRIGTLLQGETDAGVSPAPAEMYDSAAYDGAAATTSVETASAWPPDDLASPPGAELVEPTDYPPVIEDEASGLSDSAADAIEAADGAPTPVKTEVEVEPEAAPEPAGPPDEAWASVQQPSIGEAPEQDRDLIRVAAVMRLAQVLFEAGSAPDDVPPDAEPERGSELDPAVPIAEAQPLPPEIDHELRPADAPTAHPDAPPADVAPSPVKLAWSAATLQITGVLEGPIPVSALEGALTVPIEETVLPEPILPPAPRASAMDPRDPLTALKGMSESELIALFS